MPPLSATTRVGVQARVTALVFLVAGLMVAVLLINRLGGAVSLYDDATLTAKKQRLEVMIKAMVADFQPAERKEPLSVDLPLRGGTLFDFHAIGNEVTIPMQSLQFVNDLARIQAWSDKSQCGELILPTYLYRLSRQRAKIGDPIDAFALDRATLDRDPEIDKEAIRISDSAVEFITAHEIGHLALKHHQGVSREVSLQQERAADDYAMSVLARQRRNPLGAFLVLMVQTFYDPVGAAESHPTSNERFVAIANAVKNNPVAYVETPIDMSKMARGAVTMAKLGARIGAIRDRITDLAKRGYDPDTVQDMVFGSTDLTRACPQGR